MGAKMFKAVVDPNGGFGVVGFGQDAQNAITDHGPKRQDMLQTAAPTISAPEPENPSM